MKAIIIPFLFTLLSNTLLSQELKTGNYIEPKANYEININGKMYKAIEGESITIDANLVKPIITINQSELKRFDFSSIAFDYPKHMAYEFEQDFGYKNWTLTGNNIVILIFEMDVETTLTSLVNEMVKKFGKKNCSVEDFEKELGNKLCKGKQLTVTMAGQKLIMDCYEVVLNDYKSRFVYFQDVYNDNQHTGEYQQWFNSIKESIKFK